MQDVAAACAAPPAPIDAVIGIGGGGGLDLAKVVAVAFATGSCGRDAHGEMQLPVPGRPVIAMPTGGGTGAGVTCIAAARDVDMGSKVGLAPPQPEPVAAVIDPERTPTCPPGPTAAVAADTQSHPVEAFTDRFQTPGPEEIERRPRAGRNRITDVFCAAVRRAAKRRRGDPPGARHQAAALRPRISRACAAVAAGRP